MGDVRSIEATQPCARGAETRHGCYGVQVLVAGRRKHWRDAMCAEVRRAGFSAIAVDSALDALRVLALGLPVDMLLTDVELQGKLGCCRLAKEARAMRPDLAIIFARELAGHELAGQETELVPGDAVILPVSARLGGMADMLRDALGARAA